MSCKITNIFPTNYIVIIYSTNAYIYIFESKFCFQKIFINHLFIKDVKKDAKLNININNFKYFLNFIWNYFYLIGKYIRNDRGNNENCFLVINLIQVISKIWQQTHSSFLSFHIIRLIFLCKFSFNSTKL